MPQGLVLRPILFNIFLSDLFLILNDIGIASDADDIILSTACDNVDANIRTLRKSAKKLFKWFKDNQMKRNTGKGYLY